MQIIVDFSSAINQLDISAQTLENNAPLNIERGDLEQAELERRNATSYREAIQVLEREQRRVSWKTVK